MSHFALKGACWCVEGEVVHPEGNRIDWRGGMPERTGVRRELCVVPCRSCNIYEIWRGEEGGGVK